MTVAGRDAMQTLMENVGLYADDIAKVIAEMHDEGLVTVQRDDLEVALHNFDLLNDGVVVPVSQRLRYAL